MGEEHISTKDVERGLEEEEGSVLDSWMNNSFMDFYRCLGMPTLPRGLRERFCHF